MDLDSRKGAAMKWITNTFRDAHLIAIRKLNERAHYIDLVVGPPKATASYTVEQLESMDIIGLYEKE